MAERHAIAVGACNTNDILAIAKGYISAIDECIKANINPYTDAACRLICFQLAFSGNGDINFGKYYEDVFKYCIKKVEEDTLGVKHKTNEKPAYKPS